jgi:multicomponent Na+:H+ antiporter subunit E
VKAFVMNLILAVVWLILSPQTTLMNFLMGYGIGFILIFLFHRLLNAQSYVKRMFGFVLFILNFLWNFLQSNFSVARIILFVPKNQIHTGFIKYDVSGLRRFEILMLSQLITLTPGTISVELLDNYHTLLIHVLDARQPEKIYQSIDKQLKEPFLRFTRL